MRARVCVCVDVPVYMCADYIVSWQLQFDLSIELHETFCLKSAQRGVYVMFSKAQLIVCRLKCN